MTPPLRGLEHQKALWRALAADDLQIVSTDHCPFCIDDNSISPHHAKRAAAARDFTRIPNGAPGIETRMPLLFDAAIRQRIDWQRVVAISAANPAKLFGLFRARGRSRSDPTPIWRCTIRARRPLSAPPSITAGWTTACSRDGS